MHVDTRADMGQDNTAIGGTIGELSCRGVIRAAERC